jgi:hypothetical protein
LNAKSKTLTFFGILAFAGLVRRRRRAAAAGSCPDELLLLQLLVHVRLSRFSLRLESLTSEAQAAATVTPSTS